MARSAFGLSHQFKDPGAVANGFTGAKMVLQVPKCVGEFCLHFRSRMNTLGSLGVPTDTLGGLSVPTDTLGGLSVPTDTLGG